MWADSSINPFARLNQAVMMLSPVISARLAVLPSVWVWAELLHRARCMSMNEIHLLCSKGSHIQSVCLCVHVCISPHYTHCVDLSRRVTPEGPSPPFSPHIEERCPDYTTLRFTAVILTPSIICERDVYIVTQSPVRSPPPPPPPLTTSALHREVLNSWILVHFKFAMELRHRFENSGQLCWQACPRALCTGASLAVFLVDSTNSHTHTKLASPLHPVHCFLSRGVLNSLPVCVLNIRPVELQAEGPSTLRQSQPSVEGDRTVRWPPQGREQFLLLMHPRRQDWSTPYPPALPSHPTTIPFSHLHLGETNTISRVHTCTSAFSAPATSLSRLRRMHAPVSAHSVVNTHQTCSKSNKPVRPLGHDSCSHTQHHCAFPYTLASHFSNVHNHYDDLRTLLYSAHWPLLHPPLCKAGDETVLTLSLALWSLCCSLFWDRQRGRNSINS